MNRLLILLVAIFFVKQTHGQQYTSHMVAQGETMETITDKYQVSSEQILRLNPEIKGELTQYMILVIPPSEVALSASESSSQDQAAIQAIDTTMVLDTPSELTVVDTTATSIDKQEPATVFTTHRAKRRETLHMLSKQYGVPIDTLKKYNKFLYANPIEKGDDLKIPVKKTLEENAVTKTDKKRDTLAVILKDTVVLTNISSSKHKDVQKHIDTTKIVPYTVLSKEGKWRIAHKHAMTVEQLEKLNPDLAQKGVKQGQKVMVYAMSDIPVINDVAKKSVKRANYYTVKAQEGFYRLGIKLGVTRQDLEALNPELKKTGLKQGMRLLLPKGILGDQIKGNTTLLDSLSTQKKLNISLLLPFTLEDQRDLAVRFKKDVALNYALDFYSGALLALDSVKSLGISVDLQVLDSQRSKSRILALANTPSLTQSDAIIGPLIPSVFHTLATSLASKDIPMFSLSNTKAGVNKNLKNVFHILPSDPILEAKMLGYIKDNIADKNLVILLDKKNISRKASLFAQFPEAKIIDLSLRTSLRLDELKSTLFKDKKNWVLTEIENTALLTNVLGVLNSVYSMQYPIEMFTTEKTAVYDGTTISNRYLSNLQLHYPSREKQMYPYGSFVKKYKQKNKVTPSSYAAKGHDVMLDVVLRLAYKQGLYSTTEVIETQYIENKFKYTQTAPNSYINNGGYILKYTKNLDLKIVE